MNSGMVDPGQKSQLTVQSSVHCRWLPAGPVLGRILRQDLGSRTSLVCGMGDTCSASGSCWCSVHTALRAAPVPRHCYPFFSPISYCFAYFKNSATTNKTRTSPCAVWGFEWARCVESVECVWEGDCGGTGNRNPVTACLHLCTRSRGDQRLGE